MQQFKAMTQPVRLMGSMMGSDNNLNQVFESIDIFLNNLSTMLSVFQGYDGGDFCAGLYFGKSGAGMLTEIASSKDKFKIQKVERNTETMHIPRNLPFKSTGRKARF